MTTIKIADRRLGSDRQPFVIAEIGMNHNGDQQLGRKMIQRAAEAGADAVKFQSFNTDDFLSEGVGSREEYRQYELTRENHEDYQSTARSNDVVFLSTPFDVRSVDMLEELDVPCFKIASSDLTNYSLVEYIAAKDKPVFLSTGYSSMSEVATAVERFRDVGNDQLVLLHCVSTYPTDPEEMNLEAIRTLQCAFDVDVGLSDHTQFSPIAPITATAFGACVIEKHFTIDNDLSGFDHGISENPETFGEMVEQVRSTFRALGTGQKQPRPGELENSEGARRSLFWKEAYSSGKTIEQDMFLAKRPGSGLEPSHKERLLGKRLSEDTEAGDMVGYEQIDWGS